MTQFQNQGSALSSHVRGFPAAEKGEGPVTAQPASWQQLLVENISVVWMHGTRGTQLT